MNIIDVFLKYAWSVPLKDKTEKSMSEAFESVVKSSKQTKKEKKDPQNYGLTKEAKSTIEPSISGCKITTSKDTAHTTKARLSSLKGGITR